MGNKTLDAARAARLDEFHTRYGDALAGLEPFRDRLAGADILLDTNDGDWSAFWRVLSDRFDEWHIGRVRSVSWDPDWDTLFASDDGGGRVFERTRHGVTERRLACAGSIDDDEVLAMAHEADLVVGNPPFSRMSDYLPDRADTDLLCLGPLTAAAYRPVFPLVLSGRLHIASGNRGAMFFSSPAAGRLNPSALTRDGLVQVRGVVWYTTLPGEPPTYTPTHQYSPESNPSYDGLPDVAEAASSALVPCDRTGYIGAPISVLAKWPEGYRLAGMFPNFLPRGWGRVNAAVGGRLTFRRLLLEKPGRDA